MLAHSTCDRVSSSDFRVIDNIESNAVKISRHVVTAQYLRYFTIEIAVLLKWLFFILFNVYSYSLLQYCYLTNTGAFDQLFSLAVY